MQGGVDDVKRAIAAANAVADFANGALGELLRHSGYVVHASDFLNRCRRNCKVLAADAEQNDLFSTRMRRAGDCGRLHQRTPASVARLRASTRFSMAA